MAELEKNQKKGFIFAVGRRREAIARVRLYASIPDDLAWDGRAISKGHILVNKKPIEEYFTSKSAQFAYQELFRITNTLGKVTITIQVEGGGPAGQLGAVVHGLARVLDAHNPEKFHTLLKKRGFLTRDARVRERRKVGMGGKARRKRQSPKR